MLVDHERVVQRLKTHLQTKDSHGRKELLVLIGELEVECAVQEGTPERALRLYGIALSEDLISASDKSPASLAAAGGGTNGHIVDPIDA